MIVLMGVAGSGKSVQGRLLADDLGYTRLSTGEFLRQNIDDKRRREMLEGKLLDDQEIIDILGKFLKSLDAKKACVLDGFPRTLPQAKWLIDQHKANTLHVDGIFHLRASREVVKQRLLGRGRPDDNELAINKRFDEYEKSTLPILEFFKEQDISVFEINAERPVEEIHEQIMSLVNSKG